MVHKDQSSSSGKEESTSPITPSKTSNNSGQDQSHDEQQRKVVLVLPPDDLVPGQVGDIGNSDLASWFDDHPSDVRPPETLVGGVGIKLGVGVAVVSAVASRPPLDGALYCTGTSDSESVLKRYRSVV